MKRLILPLASLLIGAVSHADDSSEVRPHRNQEPKKTSELHMHDPVMAFDGDRFRIFSTGVGIDVHSSADMQTWRHEKKLSPSDKAS